MNSTNPRPVKDPWTLVIAVAFGSFMGVLTANAIPFLIGALVDGLGFSEVQGGVLGTVEMLALAVTVIVIAPLLARVSRPRVAIAGALFAIVAQLLSAASASFPVLIGLRLMTGIGLGMAFGAANATAAGACDPDRIYGFAAAFTLVLAAFVFFPAMGIAMAAAAQVGVFLVLTATVGIAAMTFRWLRVGHEPARAAALPELPTREIIVLFVIIALFNLGASPIWSFTERIGVDVGLSHERIAAIIGFTSLIGCVSALLAGWLGDRVGRVAPVAVGMLVMAMSAVAIAYAWHGLSFLGGMLLYWFAYMFLYPFLMAIAAQLDPAGRVAAAAAGCQILAFAVGPAVGGLLAEYGSYHLIGGFGVACGVIGAAVVVTAGRILNSDEADH